MREENSVLGIHSQGTLGPELVTPRGKGHTQDTPGTCPKTPKKWPQGPLSEPLTAILHLLLPRRGCNSEAMTCLRFERRQALSGLGLQKKGGTPEPCHWEPEAMKGAWPERSGGPVQVLLEGAKLGLSQVSPAATETSRWAVLSPRSLRKAHTHADIHMHMHAHKHACEHTCTQT